MNLFLVVQMTVMPIRAKMKTKKLMPLQPPRSEIRSGRRLDKWKGPLKKGISLKITLAKVMMTTKTITIAKNILELFS